MPKSVNNRAFFRFIRWVHKNPPGPSIENMFGPWEIHPSRCCWPCSANSTGIATVIIVQPPRVVQNLSNSNQGWSPSDRIQSTSARLFCRFRVKFGWRRASASHLTEIGPTSAEVGSNLTVQVDRMSIKFDPMLGKLWLKLAKLGTTPVKIGPK